MKIINIIYVLALILAIEFSPVHTQGSCCGGCGGCCGGNNNNDANGQAINGLKYFVGNWVGLDYTCRGWNKILEQVNFPDDSNQIYAKKITADECVTQGQTTFRFNSFPSELKYDTNYPVTWTVGSPGKPNSGNVGGSLRITDKDNFKIGNDRFVRGRLVNGQLVNEYAIKAPPKPCKKTFVKEVIRQLIDENGKITSTTRERYIETDAERITDKWEPNDTILQTYDNSFKPNALPNGGNNSGNAASSNTAVSEM
jgi:hypothetical protein